MFEVRTSRRRSSPIICSLAMSCCARRSSARARLGEERSTRSARRWASRRRSSSASTPTKIRRACAASTASAIASTRSISSGLARTAHDRARRGAAFGPWAEPGAGRACGARRRLLHAHQIESGVYCPIAMTYGAVPTLAHAPRSPSNGCRDFSRRATTRVSSRSARRPARSSAWA